MQDAAQTVWNWLAVTDEPTPCDIIFVFGNDTYAVAEKAAEMFEQGMAKHIICNGNTGTFGNSDWSEPIAELFTHRLVSRGIPAEAVLTQAASMNTLEDVTMGLKLIRQHGLAHDKVMIISRPVHQRRAAATYHKQHPDVILVNVPCFETPPVELSGTQLTQAAERCAQEYERLHTYAAKGDVTRQTIPDEVEIAYETIQDELARQDGIDK